MENKNKIWKESGSIKRRGFYSVLAGAATGLLSAFTFGLNLRSSRREAEVQVSLHPQAVRREKRG